MKIGVITFWQSSDNYGQQLQCWALQQCLKRSGHDIFLIRYDFINRIVGKGIKCKLKKNIAYQIAKSILKKNCSFLNQRCVDRGFSRFRRENIAMSKRTYKSLYSLKRQPPLCDVYIVGSDQVWSQLLSIEENEVFYLNFGDKKTRRISYAPSFARKEYSEELLPKLKVMLSRLDAVSVRDEASVRICETVGVEARKVADPTLLLSKDDYVLLAENNSSRPTQDAYAFIYSININTPEELRFDELKHFCDKGHLKCIATASSGYVSAKELLSVKYIYPTIGEWIRCIKDASFVVTPSFHGVVFCLIMHTPFVYIPLKGKFSGGNDRVFSLLDDLSLNSHVLSDGVSYEEILSKTIDWNVVDDGIRKMKEHSIKFLLSSLL